MLNLIHMENFGERYPSQLSGGQQQRVALARAEPVYENFRKVSETFVCTACGHCYPSREATPFVDTSGRPQVFSEADKPSAVKVFQASERRRSCAWCRHFIVNPFRQRCGLNNREVEATDLCARFSAKPDEPAADAPKSPSSDAGSRFDALFAKEAPPSPAAPASPAPAEPVPAKPAASKKASSAAGKTASRTRKKTV